MPMVSSPEQFPEKVWPFRLAALVLILGTAVLRLLYLVYDCPLDLAPDEAHYWHWSQRLDWSYYSKGPLVAFLIRASCFLLGSLSEQLTGNQMAAVRFPAVVCGALLLTSVYVLSAMFLRREKWALLMVALALTMPILSAGALLMTIDAPYTCAWGWALVFVYRALFRSDVGQDSAPDRTGDGSGQERSPGLRAQRSWFFAGVCVAIGILAKHTMVLFVPMVGLFLLATPAVRGQFRRRGFWIMLAVGALGGLPILLWNVQHDWITLKHTVDAHVEKGGSQGRIHWLGPLLYTGTQCALLLVYWFVVWAMAMVAHRPTKEARPEYRFLWFLSVPMFLFFALFSFKNGGGEPNWPVTAYLSGMVLASDWLLRRFNSPLAWQRRWTRIMVPSMACLGLVLTVVVHKPHWIQPVLVRLARTPLNETDTPLRSLDPTCRLRGWRALTEEIDRVRALLRSEGSEAVLAGGGWSLPGEISFYCAGQPTAFSLGGGLGDRHSQYDLWLPNPVADPTPFLGNTFIVVGARKDQVSEFFESVEDTRDFNYMEDGHTISTWKITVCRGFKGFASKAKSLRHY